MKSFTAAGTACSEPLRTLPHSRRGSRPIRGFRQGSPVSTHALAGLLRSKTYLGFQGCHAALDALGKPRAMLSEFLDNLILDALEHDPERVTAVMANVIREMEADGRD